VQQSTAPCGLSGIEEGRNFEKKQNVKYANY
jgi:hypothetical protein